ncbi:MAG: hypothetical protein CL777_02520 [Chloroflexi bacterium]|nr:hypothetical protein [Chloroflexota bacterium]|tara:strand:- start:1790 stop:2806 length:1017 start_codon:yes stop_codon:yes gene_type:complete
MNNGLSRKETNVIKVFLIVGILFIIAGAYSCFSQIEVTETNYKPTSEDETDAKNYLLRLINRDRNAHGVPPVDLGANIAAQLHADDMLKHGYIGHWWVDGRKPYMVYAETGGRSYASENVAFSGWMDKDWDLDDCDSYNVICEMGDHTDDIKDHQWAMMYDDAHADWGHRDNILNPTHRTVHLGITWNKKRLALVQHFSGGDAVAQSLPVLSSSAELNFTMKKNINGMEVSRAFVSFDPLPSDRSPQAINRLESYCVGGGFTSDCPEPIAMILRPPNPGFEYIDLDSNDLIADKWIDKDTDFSFSVKTKGLLQKPGVYTLSVFSNDDSLLIELPIKTE